jgi:hypothetical protein
MVFHEFTTIIMGLQRKADDTLIGGIGTRFTGRLLRIIVIASLPLTPIPSFAYNPPADPSQPAFLITPNTGTTFDVAARNHMFLSSTFEGYSTIGTSLTAPSTPWVQGQNVNISEIPFVEGEVNWDSVFKTWVKNGVRYFTGNGVPNHPTGAFPVTSGQDAYQYYAAVPDPAGEYPNAAGIPIEEYDLFMSVPENPIFSYAPTAFSEITIAIASVTGATFHANIAITGDPLYVDPVAALPTDQCFGHPYHMQYHYHGYSWKCFPNQGAANEHSPLFGYALDGFGVFGPRGDGGELLTNEDLDECHGHIGMINWDGILTNMYHYHLNNEYPYGPGCFRGTQLGVFSGDGEPVPGPAPLLGAMATLRWSRRLRKRYRPQATRPEFPLIRSHTPLPPRSITPRSEAWRSVGASSRWIQKV